MTTPNELIHDLTIKAGVMEMGEKIAWGSDTALMRQAAATLQSQAERIKELELDLDVQAGSIEAVQTVNARQAERIKELEAAPQVGYFYKWKEAMHGIARLMDERDTLRAELAAIAASHAEPLTNVRTVTVSKFGVSFGNTTVSHERITGRNEEALNEGSGGVVSNEYMKWLNLPKDTL